MGREYSKCEWDYIIMVGVKLGELDAYGRKMLPKLIVRKTASVV
jgi:hypothetical protein